MPRRSAAFLKKRGGRLEADKVVRTALRRITARNSQLPEDIILAHIDLLERQRQEHDWTEQALIESAGSLVKTTARRRAYRRLVHSVRTPTLLMHGTKDRLVPYQAGFRLAHERPDWTFRALIGLGHMPQMEDADRVMDTVNEWHDLQARREVVA
jgi:pimeloyl-ACP methyl ester carboxylesterase